MSSSSSSSFARKYDVFLSFRKEDTRRSFVSHLCCSLDKKGITTFEYELQREPPIPPELIQAIKDSSFAVVVISENYAASVWCLEELVKILEFQEKGSLILIPIFYEIEPSDSEKHLVELEKKEDPEKVRLGRSALTKLSNLPLVIYSRRWENEAEMIREITGDILNMSTAPTASDSKVPAGMDRHVKAVYELLDLKSYMEVRKVGIWGMEGVGKTVLARYVYGKISHHFDTHVFLDNVEKLYQYSDQQYSQETLLLKEIERKAPILIHSDLRTIEQKRRFGHRKVLLIADGVGSLQQCVDVNKVADYFGPGSRVILITHDKSLVVDSGIKYAYGVECLRCDEALQLFCQFAFKQTYPPLSFEQLSVRAVYLSGCLPLALKILGSFLCGKEEKDWEAALESVEAKQDKELIEALRSIYGGTQKQD